MVVNLFKITLLSVVSVLLFGVSDNCQARSASSTIEKATAYAQWRAFTGFSGHKEERDPDYQAYMRYLALYKKQAALGKDVKPEINAVLDLCFVDMNKKAAMISAELLCSALAHDAAQKSSETVS